MQTNLFNNSLGMKFTAEEVAAEAVNFMKTEPECAYKVTIGTDSMLYNQNKADLVTAVVVHKVGKGARYFWRRTETRVFHALRDRIVEEVMMSLGISNDILSYLKELNAPVFDFEIHVDVGENGKTKSMIQELVGMIRANNFEVKTKPDSYAASSVADRYAVPYR